MQNVVYLPCPSLKILGKTQKRVFPISRCFVNLLETKTVITPTGNDIDMKRGTVTKLDKRNIAMPKIMSGNCDIIAICFSL